jgi:hypothetical protein
MTNSITPPKLATLLLRLFSGEPDLPQIEGDLSEEFYNHLLASGPNVARRSYWREAFRNLWALAKRPGTIQVLAVAALSVCISVFSVGPFSHWLATLDLGGSAFTLTLLSLYLFNGTVALALGILMSRFLRGRERMLRMAVTGFYLLYIICGYAIIMGPLALNSLFTLNVINWSLVISAFWMGSLWIDRRRLRRLAG